MPTPHKHAAVIKAFADGHTIQFKRHPDHQWRDVTDDVNDSGMSPAFLNDYEYRVKPDVRRYRVGVYRSQVTQQSSPFLVQDDSGAISWERSSLFIRWVTDWVEVEV